MVPVDENGEVVKEEIISHAANSHTLVPTITHGPEYTKDFYMLSGNYLIDFAGMFDS